MRPEHKRLGGHIAIALLAIGTVCLTAACGSADQTPQPPTAAAQAVSTSVAPSEPVPSEAPRSAVPQYDLARDEALGGHTLGRHVGRGDRELADRLRREPQISAASTYTDAETAGRVVAAAIEQSRVKIESWEHRTGSRPNLVLNYGERGGQPIGRSLGRHARSTVPCHRALVVLRWLGGTSRWYVLTSYPEAN